MEEMTNKNGQVLRIERMSLHDGEGLRTVVFLKGCPLRCLWCSTPESQHPGFELGIRRNRCVGCGVCAQNCPAGAIRIVDGKAMRDQKTCELCFNCERICPKGAWQIYGSEMTPHELMSEISKDEIFYFHSGGGVTFSGGEPLQQVGFVVEVMKACQARGIQTAMESSLFAEWKDVLCTLPYMDILFADIKLMDRERHLHATGVDNTLILENIKKVCSSHYPVVVNIRIPIIPGINDDLENLEETVRFCDPLEKIREIELLPYHRLGMETYRNLNLDYKLEEVQTPTPEKMSGLVCSMQKVSSRIKVRTGGGFTT